MKREEKMIMDAVKAYALNQHSKEAVWKNEIYLPIADKFLAGAATPKESEIITLKALQFVFDELEDRCRRCRSGAAAERIIKKLDKIQAVRERILNEEDVKRVAMAAKQQLDDDYWTR